MSAALKISPLEAFQQAQAKQFQALQLVVDNPEPVQPPQSIGELMAAFDAVQLEFSSLPAFEVLAPKGRALLARWRQLRGQIKDVLGVSPFGCGA